MKTKNILVRSLCVLLTSCLITLSPASSYLDTKHMNKVEAALVVDDFLFLSGLLGAFGIYLSYDAFRNSNLAEELEDKLEAAYENTRIQLVSSGSPIKWDDDDDDEEEKDPNKIIPFEEFKRKALEKKFFDMKDIVFNLGMYIFLNNIPNIIKEIFEPDAVPQTGTTYENYRVKIDGKNIDLGRVSNSPFLNKIGYTVDSSELYSELMYDPHYVGYMSIDHTYCNSVNDTSFAKVEYFIYSDEIDLNSDNKYYICANNVTSQYPEKYNEDVYEFTLHNSELGGELNYYMKCCIPQALEDARVMSISQLSTTTETVMLDTGLPYVENETYPYKTTSYSIILNPRLYLTDVDGENLHIPKYKNAIWVHPDIADTFTNEGTLEVLPPPGITYLPTIDNMQELQYGMNEYQNAVTPEEKEEIKHGYIGDFQTNTNSKPLTNPEAVPDYSVDAEPEPEPDSGTDTETKGFWNKLWEWLRKIWQALINIYNFLQSIEQSFLNGLADILNSLLTSLLNGIIEILEYLFIPDTVVLEHLFYDFGTKFPWIPTLFGYVKQIRNNLLSKSSPPAVYVDFSKSENLYYKPIGKLCILDVSWYEEYKPRLDILIGGFLWLVFIWKIIKNIPNIISGGGMALEDHVRFDNNMDKINSTTKTKTHRKG